MRVVPILAFGGAALLITGGAWEALWFATPLPPYTEVEAAPAPNSVRAPIYLNSEPQGAEAATSLGWSCRTPCSIELVVDGPFTVTFTHRGFASSTVPVEIEAPQPGTSDAKLSPDSAFATLHPIPEPKKPLPEPKAKTEPAKMVAHRTAPPREVHEETRMVSYPEVGNI